MALTPVNSRLCAPDPVNEKFGAPTFAEFSFTTTSLAGLTALTPTPDVEDANTTVPGAYYVEDNSATDSWCGRYLAPPAAPFTVIAQILDFDVRNDFNSAGLFIGVTTPGAFDMLNVGKEAGAIRQIFVNRWTNPTTFGATVGNGVAQIFPPAWLAIRANSATSFDYLYSFDGSIWIAAVSARNPAITVNSCGIALTASSASGASAAFSYLRVWNSALALPGSA